MPLAEDSYLPDFFTPELLHRYIDLHFEFPRWCGDWPARESTLLEADGWNAFLRLDALAETFEPETHTVLFEQPPSPSFVPSPRILLSTEQGTPKAVAPPPPETNGAALAALNYVMAPWQSGWGPGGDGEPFVNSPESVFEGWADGVSEILRERLSLAVGVLEEGPSGWVLHQLRHNVLKEDRGTQERLDALKECKKYWIEIGKSVGIIPDLEGGKELQLQGPVLGELVAEGTRLVEAVIAYEPSPDELHAARELYVGGKDGLPDLAQARIDSLQRNGKSIDARNHLKRAMRRILPDEDAEKLALRFAFPMLSEAELLSTRAIPMDAAPRTVGRHVRTMIHERITRAGVDIGDDALYRAIADATD